MKTPYLVPDVRRFYDLLRADLETVLGPSDEATLTSVIGFDGGGPVSLWTFPSPRPGTVTYLTCELAVRREQTRSSEGTFELMMHADDEAVARDVLTDLARLSIDSELGHHHTVQLPPEGPPGRPFGVILERAHSTRIEGRPVAVLLVFGLTKKELQQAVDGGKDALVEKLEKAGVFPFTEVARFAKKQWWKF